MKQVNQADARPCEWLEQNLRRGVDFNALLLAMAGHDLRQNLQIIVHTYVRLASCVTSGPERERIARGQRAVMQMAEQLHQLVAASQIHQKTSEIALAPVQLSSLPSTIDTDTNRFASEQGCGCVWFRRERCRKRSSPVGERDW
jgi:hypothetical protein